MDGRTEGWMDGCKHIFTHVMYVSYRMVSYVRIYMRRWVGMYICRYVCMHTYMYV